MKRSKINTLKNGDLRVWNIINPPRESEFYPVKNLEHAVKLIDTLADSQLLVEEIECNVFGLEEYCDGEWLEWESEDGFGINDIPREVQH